MPTPEKGLVEEEAMAVGRLVLRGRRGVGQSRGEDRAE